MVALVVGGSGKYLSFLTKKGFQFFVAARFFIHQAEKDVAVDAS
jgi:hypothetical protein